MASTRRSPASSKGGRAMKAWRKTYKVGPVLLDVISTDAGDRPYLRVEREGVYIVALDGAPLVAMAKGILRAYGYTVKKEGGRHE